MNSDSLNLATVAWSSRANVGISVDQINGAHPDWLNRFVMRLKECELAVDFHGRTFAPTNTNLALRNALTRGWGHNPSGAGPRLATGQEIETDATAYRRIANELINGRHALFPLEANPAPTPVRVILGDFLGFPNFMAQGQTGIQIEIFSKDKLVVPGAPHLLRHRSSRFES